MRNAAVVLACMLAAACAPLPPAPEPGATRPAPPTARVEAPPPTTRSAFIARQAELARSAQKAGDLARAEDHWEVLALLEPGNLAFQQSLAAIREGMEKAAREQWQAGLAARRNGDTALARDAFLRTLALDPGHADAAKALRELEYQVMAKTQGDRAARARSTDEIIASARSRAARASNSSTDNGRVANATSAGVDLEQRIELVRSGDLKTGLKELRSWVDANPGDRSGRQRAGAAVADEAREAETKGQRENALALYDQAIAFAGAAAQADWKSRAQALRRSLGEHYYAEGMKVYRSDLAAAIREWETGVKFDPANNNLQVRLREARIVQQKLQKIGNR